MSYAIYGILSNKEIDLDVENKIASYDALSKVELVTIKLQNRHKVYRRCTCLWCGHALNHQENKTGKIKKYCNSYCNRRYLDFIIKIMPEERKKKKFTKIDLFKQYCLIRLVFASPAEPLNEQLKKVSRKKELLTVKV